MSLYNRMILRSLGRRNDMYATEIADELFLPVWNDLQGSVAEGSANASLTFEAYRDSSFKMYFMRHDQPDELNFAFQMPHDWDRTLVRPHIHIVPMADPASPETVSLAMTYVWVKYGNAIPAASGWTNPPNATHVVNPGDVFKATILSLGNLTPPAGTKESDILLLQVRRDPTPDTYQTSKSPGTGAANLGILSVDVHYRVGKLGTQIEFPT